MKIDQNKIFGVPIFKASYGDSEKALKSISDLMTISDCKVPSHWAADLKTSNGRNLKFLDAEVEQDIKNLAYTAICSGTATPSGNFTFDLEYWFNAYDDGNYQESHNHAPCLLSGIWFLQGDCSKLQFSTPNTMWPFTEDWFGPQVSVGDIIMFPSLLNHFVLPNKNGEKRITVAFNIRNVRFED